MPLASGLVCGTISRRVSPAGGFLVSVIPGLLGLVANFVFQELLDGFWPGCLAVSSAAALATLALCSTVGPRVTMRARVRPGRRAIRWVAVGLAAVFLAAFPAWKVWCSVAPTNYAHVGYVIDFSDDRKLAGFADDIFFARVERRIGGTNGDLPSTQFQVAVLETLKGNASGSIVVREDGGTDRFCVKFRMADNPVLMEPGREYLLFTKRPFESSDWHYLLSGVGKYEVTGPEDTNRLRERFAEAIKNEIPFSLSGPQ